MMDEFELLKKDWSKQGENMPKLTQHDIYPMLLKKSSSIVKWIFIISVIEFLFWIVISFTHNDDKTTAFLHSDGVKLIWYAISAISYGILIYFVYRFYKNYKKISAADNAKRLMENILNTRRSVKQYVVVNLAYIVISVLVLSGLIFSNDVPLSLNTENISANGQAFILIGGLLIVLVIVIALVLLFYYLVYGVLLNRLYKNYNELKKIEM